MQHERDAREFGEGASRKGGSGDAIARAIELICSRETGADVLVGEEGLTHLVAPTLAIDQYPHLFDAILVDVNAEGDWLFLADLLQHPGGAAVAFPITHAQGAVGMTQYGFDERLQ